MHLYLIAFIPIVGPVVDVGIALPFALFAAIFWNLDMQQLPTYYIHTGYNIGFYSYVASSVKLKEHQYAPHVRFCVASSTSQLLQL